ncbi:MAG: type II toxin-antitoxin system HicB family antitoxin [Chloroflexota bacterium]
MSESYFELAEKLAARPYSILKLRDETTDGASIYLARALEIENCFGQGDTPEEAEQDLRGALVDFIEGLLEDDLYVPKPARLVKTEGTSVDSTVTVTNPKAYSVNGENSYILSIHA